MKWFLKILSTIVLLFCLNTVFAQKIELSNNPDEFLGQLKNLLYETPNKQKLDRIKENFALFEEYWNSQRFNNTEKQQIITFAQQLIKDKMRSNSAFPEFFITVSIIGSTSLDHPTINDWLIYNEQIYKKNKKKYYQQLLDLQSLLQENKVGQAGNMLWYIRKANYKMEFQPDFRVNVSKCNLVCSSKNDSLVISNTKGYFNAEGVWHGQGGVVDWKRFDDNDTKDIYAELKNYQVDFKQAEYSADSVLLYMHKFSKEKILGRFRDKVFNVKPSKKTRFPYFVSYKNDFELKNIYPNIDFEGCVGMQGPNISGSGTTDRLSVLTFCQNGKAVAVLRASLYNFEDDVITSDHAELTVPLGNRDSIYNASLTLHYDNGKRNLTLTRNINNDGVFWDSYHSVDMIVDAIYWNVDSRKMIFTRQRSVSSESESFVRSSNFFDKKEFSSFQNIDGTNHLIAIHSYLQKYNDDKVDFYDLSNYLRLPESQVYSIMMPLVKNGYFDFDEDKKIAYPKENFYYSIDANRGVVDYDILKIRSFTQNRQPNMILNLDNYDLNVYGIDKINVSNVKNVVINPDSAYITIKKDLNFSFSGRLMVGLFEFYTKEGTFNYGGFTIDLPQTDSVSFYVRNDDPNHVIGEDFVRVKNVFSNVACNIEIDKNTNKSGKQKTPQYPRLNTTDESYIYFDKRSINQGLLDRDHFYYRVEPFSIDSLLTFNTENFKFKGELFSNNMFPELKDVLMIQDDYSLGLSYDFGDEGCVAFGEKSTYYNKVKLSNDGFFGEGRITYQNMDFASAHFIFYPDSVSCVTDRFEMVGTTDALSCPSITTDTANLCWQYNADTLLVSSLRPFEIYHNASFDGAICHNNQGVSGRGALDFDDLKIKSEHFDFENQAFVADTSDFVVMSGETEALLARDFNTRVDFSQKKGSFRYLNPNSSTLSFPVNQFACNVSESEWAMEEGLVNVDTRRIFTTNSVDTLFIDCKKVDYDINEHYITAYNVAKIATGNAVVIPPDGIVRIRENATFDTIYGATIVFDSLSHGRTIADIDVVVDGKSGFSGQGYCQYIDAENNKYDILLTDIHQVENGITIGRGIVDENDPLRLNKYFDYKGEVIFQSDRNELLFNGFAKVNDDINLNFGWFPFSSKIFNDSIILPFHQDSVMFVTNGLYHDSLTNKFFVKFLAENDNENLVAISSLDGNVRYDTLMQSYVVENQQDNKVSSIVLNTKNNFIAGELDYNFGFNNSLLKFENRGAYQYDFVKDSLVFNVDLTFDFPMDNMLLYKIYDTINQLYHLDTTAVVVLEEFSQDDVEAAALEMEAMEEDLSYEMPLEDKVEEDFVEDADLEEFIDDEELDKETRKAREKERKAREKERKQREKEAKQRAKEREKELKKQAKEREKALKEAQEKREQLAKDAENAQKEKERQARNSEKTSVVTLDSVSLIYYPQANSFLADDSIVVSSMCGNKLNVKMAAKVLVNLNEPSATIFLQVDEHLWYYFRYEGEYVEMLANTDSFNYRLDDMKEKDRIFTDKKTGCRLGYGVSDYYYVEEFLNFVKNLEK